MFVRCLLDRVNGILYVDETVVDTPRYVCLSVYTGNSSVQFPRLTGRLDAELT